MPGVEQFVLSHTAQSAQAQDDTTNGHWCQTGMDWSQTPPISQFPPREVTLQWELSPIARDSELGAPSANRQG